MECDDAAPLATSEANEAGSEANEAASEAATEATNEEPASQQQYELVQLSATVSRYRAVGPS